MQKKLPKIYQSSFSHKVDNNNKVFYSFYQNKPNTETYPYSAHLELNQQEEKSVESTLRELFQTTGYIFNIPVEIKTHNRKLDTKIAGKVKNTIITLDNDVIPISEIVSIKRKDR